MEKKKTTKKYERHRDLIWFYLVCLAFWAFLFAFFDIICYTTEWSTTRFANNAYKWILYIVGAVPLWVLGLVAGICGIETYITCEMYYLRKCINDKNSIKAVTPYGVVREGFPVYRRDSYPSETTVTGYGNVKIVIKDPFYNCLPTSGYNKRGFLNSENVDEKYMPFPPSFIVQDFGQLADLFNKFLDNYQIPKPNDFRFSNRKIRSLVATSDAMRDYVEFYKKATDIYNNSFVALTKNCDNDISKSVLISLNSQSVFTFGSDVLPSTIDYQKLLRMLFGLSSFDVPFYTKEWAEAFREIGRGWINDFREANNSLNACFLCNCFIFPIVITGELSTTVLAYLITGGRAGDQFFLWINNVFSALQAINFYGTAGTKKTITNQFLYKETLFMQGYVKNRPNTTEIQNAIWRKWRDKLLSELREMDAKSFLWDSSLVNAVLELSNKHEVNLWDYIRGKPINTRRSIEKANNFVSWFAQICIDNHEEIVEKTKSYGNSFDKTSTTIEQRLLNMYNKIPTYSILTIPSYYKEYQVFDAKNETYSFDSCLVDFEDNVVYYDNGYKQGDTKNARIPKGYRPFYRFSDDYFYGYDVFDKAPNSIRRPRLNDIFLYTVYALTLRDLYSIGIQPNKIGRLHYASPYSDPKGKERTIKFIKAVYKLKDEEPYASYSKNLRLGCDGIYGEKRDEYFENRRAYKSAIEYLRKSFNLVDYYAQVHFPDEVKEERNTFIQWFNEDAEKLREKPLDIIE